MQLSGSGVIASSLSLLICTQNPARCQAEIPSIAPPEIVEPPLPETASVLNFETGQVLPPEYMGDLTAYAFWVSQPPGELSPNLGDGRPGQAAALSG